LHSAKHNYINNLSKGKPHKEPAKNASYCGFMLYFSKSQRAWFAQQPLRITVDYVAKVVKSFGNY